MSLQAGMNTIGVARHHEVWVACRHSAKPGVGMDSVVAASMPTQRFAS